MGPTGELEGGRNLGSSGDSRSDPQYQGRGLETIQWSQGQRDCLPVSCSRPGVMRALRLSCIPAASGPGQEELGIRFNSSQWAILAGRGAWGRGAEQSRIG